MSGIKYPEELYKATVEIANLKKMVEAFAGNISSIQAEAAKQAIYALFEAGNCPQYENGAGDGYIECGDALKFADEYANKIREGE
jgi:hypothetical protein